MRKTKVIIGGITIKDTDGGPDPNKLISWEYGKDDDAISEAELILPKTVNDLVDLTNGQVVEIWAGYTTSTDKRFFYGFIDDVSPDGATLKVLCKNEMIMLVRKNVNKIYDSGIDASAGEISEIVEDLIETYGGLTAVVQPSGTEDGVRLDQFKCINADVFERVNSLKKALDWELIYNDSDRKVYFQSKGFTDSGITLTVGTEIVAMPEWDIDISNMINDLRIDGASSQTDITETGRIETTSGYLNESILLTKTPDVVELIMDSSNPPTTQKEGGTKDSTSGHFYYIDRENKKIVPKTGTTFTTNDYAIVNYVWSSPSPVHMINQASIDLYGSYEKQIELSDVSSVADAESRGTSILSKRSLPFVTGKFPVRSASGNIPNQGEIVNIVDTKTPTVNGQVLSGAYVLNRIIYKFPSAVEILEVGDKIWRLADWQTNTEDRLKRLEEQFIRNQDIILELVDIQNFKANNLLKTTPRYQKAITRDTSTNMIWGRDDWGSDDWNGTYDESEVDDSVQQFENKYTENFVDTDFKDTGNTTATWSTTGSLVFT